MYSLSGQTSDSTSSSSGLNQHFSGASKTASNSAGLIVLGIAVVVAALVLKGKGK